MPYVERTGLVVTGIWATQQYAGQEYLPDGHADLLPTLAEYKATARKEVDIEAGIARSRFPSPGFLVEQEYKHAESGASSYVAAGYTGTVPVCVQDWATVNGWTAQQAADDIIATAAVWYGIMDIIRGHRLIGKKAIEVAIDAAGVDTEKALAIANLRGVIPQ